MKIILSKANGGKTTKVASMMSEFSHLGVDSLIISKDLNFLEFKEYAIEAKAFLEKLHYTPAHTLGDIMKAIEDPEEEYIKEVFIDFGFDIAPSDLVHKDSLKELLTMLYNLEKKSGKNVYVTMQTGMSNKYLEESKVAVIDY